MQPHRLRLWSFCLIFASLTVGVLIASSLEYRSSLADISRRLLRIQTVESPKNGIQSPKSSTSVPVPCYGPRGVLLDDSIDDQLNSIQLDGGRGKRSETALSRLTLN